MRILLCPDKFKGTLSALEVCQALQAGLAISHPNDSVDVHPMADGGDGSLDILNRHLSLSAKTIYTADPLGREIAATYFFSESAAFIELSKASGLVLLQPSERNPELTSTLGTGKVIADALAAGHRHIYLFLGGSATNDGGLGIASALGYRFLDASKGVLDPIGANLSHIHYIQRDTVWPATEEVSFTLLCDVTNPLYGPLGAAAVYSRQKGATETQVRSLDDGLRHYADLLLRETGIQVAGLPGAGAAGGIGASMVALFGGNLKSGFTALADLTGLEARIQSADWVISGEGSLDHQSLDGKLVAGLAALCRKHAKPLVLVVGKNELSESQYRAAGIEAVWAITDYAPTHEAACSHAYPYIAEIARSLL